MTLFYNLKQLKLIIRPTLKQNNHRSVKKSNSSSTLIISDKKNIVVLGDSMIKHVNRYDMSKKLENCKV